MFPTRLSEVTAVEIHALISNDVSEGSDIEFKRELPAKNPPDAWMSGGRIGDEAKDQLAAEIIAFANTDGGTLVLGLGEDSATKKAVAPIRPLPKCKEAANSLFQSISSRVEPRLPMFECAGVVTEQDGTSGVVIMRTLPSYLAPHRHTQDRHCYVRRNDAAVPMSMVEIQEMTRRTARTLEDIDRAFAESSERLLEWIPAEYQWTHPVNGVRSVRSIKNRTDRWVGSWALRVTARPVGQQLLGDARQWLGALEFPQLLRGSGRQGQLWHSNLEVIRTWQPRLRAFERAFKGDYFEGLDRVGADGQIERRIFQTVTEEKEPRGMFFIVTEFFWSVASLICYVDAVRCRAARPSQVFALEIELLFSHSLYLIPHPGSTPPGSHLLPPYRVLFPRYEIGPREEFDELLTTIDTDLWNSAGYQTDWKLAVDWPKPKI
jgi:Putative DNA-binding domain